MMNILNPTEAVSLTVIHPEKSAMMQTSGSLCTLHEAKESRRKRSELICPVILGSCDGQTGSSVRKCHYLPITGGTHIEANSPKDAVIAMAPTLATIIP